MNISDVRSQRLITHSNWIWVLDSVYWRYFRSLRTAGFVPNILGIQSGIKSTEDGLYCGYDVTNIRNSRVGSKHSTMGLYGCDHNTCMPTKFLTLTVHSQITSGREVYKSGTLSWRPHREFRQFCCGQWRYCAMIQGSVPGYAIDGYQPHHGLKHWKILMALTMNSSRL